MPPGSNKRGEERGAVNGDLRLADAIGIDRADQTWIEDQPGKSSEGWSTLTAKTQLRGGDSRVHSEMQM